MSMSWANGPIWSAVVEPPITAQLGMCATNGVRGCGGGGMPTLYYFSVYDECTYIYITSFKMNSFLHLIVI